jgi:hypothetical protein
MLLILVHKVIHRGQDSSVGIATGQAGQLGFDSQQGQEIFLFSVMSGPALGTTQPPIQWVPRLFSQG